MKEAIPLLMAFCLLSDNFTTSNVLFTKHVCAYVTVTEKYRYRYYEG